VGYTSIIRARKKAETRAAILRSARNRFFTHGFDTPSLDEISADAKVTRGALYVHFQDRDALAVAVMDEVLAEYIQELTAAVRSPRAFHEIVITTLGKIEQTGEREPGVSARQLLYVLSGCVRYPDVRARYTVALEQTEGALATAFATQGHAEAPAKARLLMAASLGLVTLAQLGAPYPVQPLLSALDSLLTLSAQTGSAAAGLKAKDSSRPKSVSPLASSGVRNLKPSSRPPAEAARKNSSKPPAEAARKNSSKPPSNTTSNA
jgi:AcrR family transcriptional regulator